MNTTPRTTLNNKELEDYLKETYRINKNISKQLSKEQKQQIIVLLETNEAVLTLVQALISKNQEISNNNRRFGKERERAKEDLCDQQEENEKLNDQISQLHAEIKKVKQELHRVLQVFQQRLINNMVERSEIIQFVSHLLKIYDK